ncbi:GFA family protein [Marinobacter salinisoli]|uniref:GFA family protein n=1 Tax=Marinobacter salinisoli TaxID=2769486 RepID=A0ABX7MP64_9GAMM|nr:GFA family protein [Marinobacter salinisoli]QSP93934.1 GFA family protein [Marinobacter salinisoli]
MALVAEDDRLMSDQHTVHCDCGAVEVTMLGQPRVHGYCHCEDCRELLQVPYHSVLAWEGDKVGFSSGEADTVEFKHPEKQMTRVFCKHCGEVLYNTNKMGWKLVSQLLFKKCHGDELPAGFEPTGHFFYARRVIDIGDNLPKK